MPDVKIKGYSGEYLEYKDVPKVYLAALESTDENPVLVPFSYGDVVEGTEIVPDFTAGDMMVSVPEGYLVKSAVIKKPETLLPENIAKDVEIAGITGTHEGGSGGSAVIMPLEVTENGTYTASEGFDGFSPVIVNVERGADTDDIDMLLDEINGEIIGAVIVTFIGADGSVLCTVPVTPGTDCPDPTTTGMISKPAKNPTTTKVFTFSGWSLTDGGSATGTALENVTEDRTVYAAFTSSVRKYTVRYYDGETLKKTEYIEYGESSSYKLTVKGSEIFVGWDPEPNNITKDMDCYAQWKPSEKMADYTWTEIAELAESGEAATRFIIGDEKTLKMTIGSNVYTLTGRLIDFDHDDLSDGTGKAGMTIEIYDLPKIGLTQQMTGYYPTSDAWMSFDQNAKEYIQVDLRQRMKQVAKICYNRGDKTYNVLNAYMWRFSMRELDFSGSMIPNDGEPYSFYDGTNKTATPSGGEEYSELIRYGANTGNIHNGAELWNTRSPQVSDAGATYVHWYIGRKGSALASATVVGCSPVLCFAL